MPTITESQYSKIFDAYSFTTSRLEDLLKNEYLPNELKDEINVLIQKFKEYDVTKHREAGKMLKGNILTPAELKKIVIDATGYNKWSIETQFDEDNLENNYKYLLEYYGVKVEDKKKISTCHISRNVRSRDDVWLISFTCLPGHVNISFDTGRANWDANALMANKDIKKIIEENCE